MDNRDIFSNTVSESSDEKHQKSLPSESPLSEMTSSELYDLVCRADRRDETAIRTIFGSFEDLIMSVAAEYADELNPEEELVNEGIIALMRAIQWSAEDKETDFLKLADELIRQAIKHEAERVKISREAFKKYNGILSKYDSIIEKTGSPPAPEEFGLPGDIPEKKYRRIIETLRNFRDYVSHKLEEEEDEELVLSSMTDLERQLFRMCSEEVLSLSEDQFQEIWRSDALSERDKKILSLRFGLEGNTPINEYEIGRRLGITRARVVHIETRALKRICSHVNSEDIFTKEVLRDL